MKSTKQKTLKKVLEILQTCEMTMSELAKAMGMPTVGTRSSDWFSTGRLCRRKHMIGNKPVYKYAVESYYIGNGIADYEKSATVLPPWGGKCTYAPICQLDGERRIVGQYGSVKEAAEKTGSSMGLIYRCIRIPRYRHNGFHWSAKQAG